ncbi:hypothetical protein V8D89_007024 [Ganoderma adspersum]
MQERTIYTPLPTETWIQVIRELPFHYQKSCLSISKFFHDIAVQYVFASINIRLGNMRDFYLADEDRWCNWNADEKAEADAAVNRSYELLKHLTSSSAQAAAGFVRAVKYVSVRAYFFPGESLPDGLLDTLEEALSVLRLREFAWYGCHPMPRSQVLETLSTGSRDTMEEIVLPAELLDHIPVLPFTRLKSLSFLNRYGNCYQCLGRGNSRCFRMGKTVTATLPSLRSLSIFGEALWKCKVQGLSVLTELTLALMDDVDPISAIITRCSRLQSLTILVGPAHSSDDLAAVLHAHPSALPRLTAFRMYFPAVEPGMMESVAAFLRTKPLLERFELGHRWEACLLDAAEPMLETLAQLPRLRVLGLELSGGSARDPALRPSHLQHLARRIPPQVTALSLWVDARFPSTTREADWTQFFHGLRSCRFIHVSSAPDYRACGELQRALFVHPPPSAELVGFNEDIRWVEREWGTGRWMGYSESWPLSRVYNRTVEDFGCEEWEWLLRPIDMRLM